MLKPDKFKTPQLPQKTITFGFIRDDGDLQILGTLNNNDEYLTTDQFNELVALTLAYYNENPAVAMHEEVKAYYREDTVDYAELAHDENVGEEWEGE